MYIYIYATIGSIKQSNTHWASLGQSEFDLAGTCATVGASRRSRPDLPLVINIDALGRSEITMPGDDAHASRAGRHQPDPPLLLNLDSDTLGQSEIAMPGDAADMEEESITKSDLIFGCVY
jgi:hypothetical protein